MQTLFNPDAGKLFDLLQGVLYAAHEKTYDEILSDLGIDPRPEILEAHAAIRSGIDPLTPGLQAFMTLSGNRDRFIHFLLKKRIWEWKTFEEFHSRFEQLLHCEARYEILAYFDPEERPMEDYRDMLGDMARLYDFVFGLPYDDRVKLEILGIASDSGEYAASLCDLFRTVSLRVEDVYKKNEDLLNSYSARLAERTVREKVFLEKD